MTAMSGFYKLANVVQSIHDTMTISYGFPVWASYVIFGLVTLACGLTAGLIIVCCMDCLSTPTTPERRAAIIEKNRRAREERDRQDKLAKELEEKRKEKQQQQEQPETRGHGEGDGLCHHHAHDAAQAFPRAEHRVKGRRDVNSRPRGGAGGGDREEYEPKDEELRRRFGYQILDEDEAGSTEEEEEGEDAYGSSEDERVSTEAETESSDYDPEDYGGNVEEEVTEKEKGGEEKKKDK